MFAFLLPAVFASAAGGQAQLVVFCKTEDRAIAHARVSLYLIGAVEDSTLVPEAPYNEVSMPIVKASSAPAEIAAAADALQAYINEKKIAPAATADTDAQGKAQFDALPIGAYLVLADFSETADAKDASALPALVFVLPKTAEDPDPTEVILKIEKPPETTTVPTTRQPPELPYTGQLWWPVPALAAAGAIFIACGIRARRQKQETER